MHDDAVVPIPPRSGASPTPPAGRWETLEGAYAAHGWPAANLPLVRRLVDSIGVDHYVGIASRTYFRGVRRGPGRDLYIASGYTGGLQSEAEILEAVGEVERSTDGHEWWMHHPVNRLRDGNGSATESRDYGTCATCGMTLPASGACDLCS